MKDAFRLYEDFKKALSVYGIALHVPVISSKLGKYDSVDVRSRLPTTDSSCTQDAVVARVDESHDSG